MSNQITLSKITAEIASALKKELDEPFKRMLADKVDAWRGTLLRRTLKENPNERVHFKQTLHVKFTKVSPVPTCIDESAPVCDVMRSVMKIPKAIRAGETMYDYVGSIDGYNPFRRKEPGTGYYMKAGKYSKGVVLWEEVNGYLEIDNAVGLPLARVDGVFDNPREVVLYNCETSDCDYWNAPYPISNDIHQAIVECILKVDFAQGIVPASKDVDITPQKQEHVPDGR